MMGWVLRAGLGAVLGGAAAGLLAACSSSSSVFTCASDTDCTGEGNGTCQANGFCAFPDAMCESGMRYGDLAGGGFANMCVPIEDGGSTGGVGGSSDTSTSGPETTLTPGETSGDTGSSSAEATSSSTTEVGDSSSTGVSLPCEIIFDDDFVGGLPAHWTILGTDTVEAEVGAAEFRLDSGGPNSATFLQHDSPVPFDGVWLMANIDELPSREGVQAILALTRESMTESYIAFVDTGTQELVAGHVDGAMLQLLEAIPYDLQNGWLRIREFEGEVLFETGPDDDELSVFHQEPADIRDWTGRLSIGADNYIAVSDETVVRYDDARACAQQR